MLNTNNSKHSRILDSDLLLHYFFKILGMRNQCLLGHIELNFNLVSIIFSTNNTYNINIIIGQ